MSRNGTDGTGTPQFPPSPHPRFTHPQNARKRFQLFEFPGKLIKITKCHEIFRKHFSLPGRNVIRWTFSMIISAKEEKKTFIKYRRTEQRLPEKHYLFSANQLRTCSIFTGINFAGQNRDESTFNIDCW